MANTSLFARTLRGLTLAGVVLAVLFLFNNYLTYWQGWPGFIGLAEHYGWGTFGPATNSLPDEQISLGWWQTVFYLAGIALCFVFAFMTPGRAMQADAHMLAGFAAYLVRGCFWGVFLIGLADAAISFLRVEDLLAGVVGEQMAKDLGRSAYRGAYVHFPLLGIGFVIALFVRALAFVWLAVLVVIAEFQIVISRFVFSYEQAFMGDLVRFWYASLFLLGSAYALAQEGHVRVDVIYAHFSARAKAWVNTFGCSLLGLPLCWVILTQGMWTKGSSLNSPLLSYEISQTGFGMYVKYLMAGLLVAFALSMTAQFSAYFLQNVGRLRGEEPDLAATPEPEASGAHG